MKAEDVTDTLDLALQASGCDQVHVVHKPRLLSDNCSSYVSGELAEWLGEKGMKHSRGAPYHLLPGRRCLHRREGPNTGKNREVASNLEEPHFAGKLLPAGQS
jgi:transposase InsO family protein